MKPASLQFDVRDYECDLQGIVNNAVYLHYLEHARHRVLAQHGLSFAELSTSGVDLVVVRIEIDYKSPLKSGDQFVVESTLSKLSPVRFAFLQDIVRVCPTPRAVIAKATVVCAAMDRRGKPIFPTVLDPLFSAYNERCALRSSDQQPRRV